MIAGIDPLGAKNLTMMFGHCIANLSMFFMFSIIYDVMPHYSGRPWKTNWMVVAAWNVAIIYILLAMFHHLYMDFVQPLPYQILGQIFSYIAFIPAIVVTIIGAFAQIFYYKAKTGSFSMIPAFILAGILSFLIGGAAAEIDATIPVNFVFHNTLWVPAHFHTYFAYGVVIMLIAARWYILEVNGRDLQRRQWLSILVILTVGYAIFLASFYLGGMMGIPRRYDTYQFLPEPIANAGALLAGVSVIGIIIAAVAYIVLYYKILKASIIVYRK